jgi:hypothetical protein
METKTVNLRDIPEDFVRRAKAYAALSGLSLKDFFIQSVESAMQNEIQAKGVGALFTKDARRKKAKD